MGTLLTRRQAERFDLLLDGRMPAVRAGERERLDVVTALRACPPLEPGVEFRAFLRTRLLTGNLNGEPLRGEAPAAGEPARSLAAPSRHSARNVLGARPALIGALATSVVVTGIAVGTHRAVPGEPFYGLKLQVEHIQLDLTNNRLEKAKVHLDIARTRLHEIRTIMDGGMPLPKKTTEVRNLLTAWQSEASAGGNVLVVEAQGGSQEALRVVQDFTTDQSRNLNALLASLPDGQLHAMTTDALNYVHGVHDTVSGAGIAATRKAGDPAGTPTPVDTSRGRQPVGNPGDAPRADASASSGPAASALTAPVATEPATADAPATTGPASTPSRSPGTRASGGTAHAPTASPTTASTEPGTGPTGITPEGPEGIVADVLKSAGIG